MISPYIDSVILSADMRPNFNVKGNRMNGKSPSNKGTALVTGSSSGIGLTFAEKLAVQGYNLVLVARSKDKLEQLATQWHKDTGVDIEVLTADLSDQSDLRRVEARLEQGDINLLVNNAGLGEISKFVDSERDSVEQMVMVNVVALMRLTHAVLPSLIKAGSGTVINVSSGLAYSVTDYGFSVYGGTKSFVSHFTEMLRDEIKNEKIYFQVLIPGLTRTNLGGAEESGFFDNYPAHLVMSTEDLVDASLKGLELGELFCFPRLENIEEWEQASAAIRAVGESPPHNRVASRYGV